MSAPTGEQYSLSAHGYEAVVTQSGVLASLRHAGRDLVDGVPDATMPAGGRGQLLVPWPNRIRDGRYRFDGADQQLALTEPKRHNASHGLVRWVSWSVLERTDTRIVLGYFLPAQTGYPWALALRTTYALDEGGLTVVQEATNLADTRAPYASGAHPYLLAGEGPCDGWELTLPATTRLLTDDERLLPVWREAHDAFVDGALLGATVLNHAYTDLRREDDGRAEVRLRAAATGVALWVDEQHRWLQVYTADDTATPRVSVAVEPMTAPPDAFNSGEDLTVIEPGDTVAARWGIRAL
ncbi:aldose 1-epimerase family protein [Nocardioides sp.]|uniref:aldose 1-epimerase family protein n=1 Tax=Nocardioides sp. TaxID=35761 RepID=UPI003511A702